MKFCGEIQYNKTNETGEVIDGVHSDICFNCNPSNDSRALTPDYREFLHKCLDEWFDKSNGTGAFWVGDPQCFYDWDPR